MERTDSDLSDVIVTSNDLRLAPTNQDAADRIYGHLSNAIMAQQLKPGLKLGEEKLSSIFKTGRPVIRRALTRLAQDQVVEIIPNRGAFVAKPTAAQARQVFEARRVIEQATVRACVGAATKSDISSLREHVSIEDARASEGERADWIRLSGEFHLKIARIGGNLIMVRMLRDLIAQTSLIIGLYGNRGRSICHNDDHQLLVDAIAAGNEKKAIGLMLEHLQECESSLTIDDQQDEADLDSIFENVG